MEVHVTISVRNPEWYWSREKIKESEGYYEEWKALNADKMWKMLPSWTLKIDFEVDTFEENRNTDYELKYCHANSHENLQSILLNDMTHVVFKGKEQNETAEIAISNSIIHSFFGAQKVGRTHYWYVYIKEDADYEKLTPVIVVNRDQANVISSIVQNGYK